MLLEVVDLFCGVGGLTCGMEQAGLSVVAGFDNDITCKFPYTHNNNSVFYCKDIRKITSEEIDRCYNPFAIKVLVGCAPCQPFSTMSYKKFKSNLNREQDSKYNLLSEFGRIIKKTQPAIISMENVPEIRKAKVFFEFISILRDNGYYTDGGKVIYCPDYGIPQNRHRFVLLASKFGEIHLLPPTHDRKTISIKPFIDKLPRIKAGETCSSDYLHRSAKLSPINLKRIRFSTPGGTWRDWPKELVCNCHRKESGKTFSSVYGRMSWDKIGSTITTQFVYYGTGRYGHPEQDRALSLREGALLQTFPIDYEFVPKNVVSYNMRDVARQIGNAVPVRLGEIIGLSIIKHIKEFEKYGKNN